MAFDVNEFQSSFTNPPAKTNHFEVLITAPISIAGLGIGNTSNFRDLTLRCTEAEFPAKVLASAQYSSEGKLHEVVYGEVHEDVTLTFLCSHDMRERKLFDAWQRKIVDVQNSSYVNYFNTYKSTISVHKSDPCTAYTDSYQIQIHDTYPKSIGQITTSWDSTDEIMRFPVTFPLTHWTNY